MRERLLQIANQGPDVALCNQSALDGARVLDRMEHDDARRQSGEVWIIDFGMAAKVRPALLLTGEPAVDEFDLVTVLLHTTALRGNRWELAIDKPFLKSGAFHLQQVQTISTVKLERRLGVLNGEEMNRVLAALRNRLSI